VFFDRDGALRHGYRHRNNQFIIGDRETDMECGRRAGGGAALLSAGSHDDFVGQLLATKMTR
jgi:histidinol phosphatase-like enzyme